MLRYNRKIRQGLALRMVFAHLNPWNIFSLKFLSMLAMWAPNGSAVAETASFKSNFEKIDWRISNVDKVEKKNKWINNYRCLRLHDFWQTNPMTWSVFCEVNRTRRLNLVLISPHFNRRPESRPFPLKPSIAFATWQNATALRCDVRKVNVVWLQQLLNPSSTVDNQINKVRNENINVFIMIILTIQSRMITVGWIFGICCSCVREVTKVITPCCWKAWDPFFPSTVKHVTIQI